MSNVLQFEVWPEAVVGMDPAASELRQSSTTSPLTLDTVTLAGEPDPIAVMADPTGVVESTPVKESVPTTAAVGALENVMDVFAVAAGGLDRI